MIKYAITYHNSEGMRVCLGRSHDNYDTDKQAQQGLGVFFRNHPPRPAANPDLPRKILNSEHQSK
jgi:hypothetical protein